MKNTQKRGVLNYAIWPTKARSSSHVDDHAFHVCLFYTLWSSSPQFSKDPRWHERSAYMTHTLLWPWKTEQKHLLNKRLFTLVWHFPFRFPTLNKAKSRRATDHDWNFDCLVDDHGEWERAWLTYFFDPPWEIKEVELLKYTSPTKHETYSSLQKKNYTFLLRMQITTSCEKLGKSHFERAIFFGKMCGFWRAFER